MSLADEKYVSVTTFRKSGVEVATPVWIVPLGEGKVGFWTSSQAGKAKRLRNNPAVRLVASDGRGRVKAGAEPVRATAALVENGPEFEAIQQQVKAKYGLMVGVSRVFNRLGHLGKAHPYGDLGVVITLEP